VGNAQTGLRDDLLPVEEQVEVDRPRSVALAGAHTPELALHLEQAIEESARRELGADARGRVEEVRLLEEPDRLGFTESRHGKDVELRIGSESFHGPAHVPLTVAEVGADTHVGFRHVVGIFTSLNRFGVLIVLAAAMAAAWPTAGGSADLTALERAELRAYPNALVLAGNGRAEEALRRAGGTRLTRTTSIWRVPGRAALRLAPLAELVEPDRPVAASNHFGSGDSLVANQWWISPIGANAAEPPGAGIPVTVIDTGVDLSHPEFTGRPGTLALNAQNVSGQQEEHGTAVASVVAAASNGVGVVGVYPQAGLQVWDASPSGTSISVGLVVAGIDTAVRRGPSVINLSLGTIVRDPLLETMTTIAFGSGSLVVAAAGNDRSRGSPLEYPASFPHVLTVGATDDRGRTAFFSSSSPFLDLSAPGQLIPVAVPLGHDPTGYSTFSGTSFASPLVAGAAAWIWTARPTLDVTQLFDLMRTSSRDIESSGFDPLSGYGQLYIPSALSGSVQSRDPTEPNEDISHVKPNRLFRNADPPITSPGRTRGSLNARLDFSEDPRDLYRIWVPARRTTIVTLTPTADVDLAVWGPRTVSVLEGARARRRDFRGRSERSGTKAETVRVRNTSSRGSFHYVEASVGSSGRPLRSIGGIRYRLSVRTATLPTPRARR
jgi:subtilisin family serine protease